jgi:dehydrogenase/reductase SDR family member 12
MLGRFPRPAVLSAVRFLIFLDSLPRIGSQEQRLDVLVNNAGVMPGQRTRTVDGVELTFATHVLAPWVLIEGLAPLLRNAAPSRVINVTSGGQYGQKIPGGDIESDRAKYGPRGSTPGLSARSWC